ncbi:MAG TPA: hypothetical protein VMU04_12245 [Candidatus Acidoferrum sp.]|nr:hypothetical protein [Candidatus Acidoferrum sp.]
MNWQGTRRWQRHPCAGPSVRTGRPADRRKLAALSAAAALIGAVFLLSSCATTPQATVAELPRFHSAANADLIFRYFSDQVSHVEKPLTMEGPFLVACERTTVLKLAAGQPRHELAVILLIHYFSPPEENRVKLAWRSDLQKLGYKDIVFLLAGRTGEVDGLPILPPPQENQAVAQQ